MKKNIFIPEKAQLLILPLVFLGLQIMLKVDYKWYFLSVHDPAYAFLFNGLNIANGSLQLGLSGFPGTILQCLIGLNLALYKVFTGTTNLTIAVISDPEFFLNIISVEILIFNTVALAFLGLHTWRNSGNLPLSLALQLTPFISLKAFSMNSVVTLEPFLLCTELLLLMIIAKYVFSQIPEFTNRMIVLSALLMAIGFATKTVFLPVLILPFFAIEGFRKRLLYGLMIAVFTALLLIPVYPTFSSFISWYKLILTHTGVYGSGQASLFDARIYFENLLLVFRSNVIFSIAFLIIIIIMGIIRIPAYRDRIPAQKRKIINGLGITFMINIIMVARHFSSHYLYVSYNLSVFAVLLAITLIPKMTSGIFQKKAIHLAGVYAAGFLLIFILISEIQFSPGLINPRLKAYDFVKSEVRNTQRIIILENPGPFIETALFHGYAYSAGMMPAYAPVLKKLYPSTYFYNPGQGRLNDWVVDINPEFLFSQSHSTYLYCALNNDTLPPLIAQKINDLKKAGLIRSVMLKYSDSIYRDRIYEIRSDSQKIGQLFSAPDTIYNNNQIIHLDEQNPFGSTVKINAQKGFYRISARRRSADSQGSIVAADSTGMFYRSNAISFNDGGDNELITLVADIPDYLIGKKLSFYLWYPGKHNCTFKEFNITFIRENAQETEFQ